MSDEEKMEKTSNLDHSTDSHTEVSQGVHDPDAGLSAEERAKIERKLLWKLDLKLMPWLSLLYLIAFLDRTNIGNAKIAHLELDIGVHSTAKYNATLTIFFVSYALFEPVCNVLLKRLRPSIFIPIIMVLWGATMIGMGFVRNWSELMAARWFLGMTESGLFPGINYYLSCWYKRSEFGVRAAIFFSAAAISGSFGGLLAAAIQNMNGLGGRPGWSWIFIIEGGITVLIALASFWMVDDFPSSAKFLTSDDRARVVRRLEDDKQASAHEEHFKSSYLIEALKDWKTYCGMLIYMGPLMPLYAFSLFLPTIIQSMNLVPHNDIVKNQLLSVPPYILAAIMTVVIGFWSDRVNRRGVFNMGCALVGTIGFIMMISTTKPVVQYIGTFLGALGIYPSVSLTIAWVANNVEGVYKRGVVLGLVIGWGNLNGVVSSNVYFDKPRFFAGHATIIGYLVIAMFGGSLLFQVLLARENKKRLAGERDHLIAGKSAAEIEALGDNRPDFIYTL
ncbi:hypothetical protein LMH87_010225 [Akanthomyces muscarius]|uniref:Major facilitator superfamily (MFS) profile domain-containing protein n=1 Tax=Akanthomyces muscarius TaxID=2231603 RepID=A0A9W8QDC9_AKAMU|nr:hypothetical protein LMH87_010225 [Akanthomyces muscarius]KAJ4153751.1 hypothetical protein LMH87_010225 [Akanthomyces muscarius]